MRGLKNIYLSEKNETWGPFLESPGNLTGSVSYFEIKFSRKVCCVLTSISPAKRSQHSAQHIPRLLGATCCVRLATLLRHVACCWLKFEAGQI